MGSWIDQSWESSYYLLVSLFGPSIAHNTRELLISCIYKYNIVVRIFLFSSTIHGTCFVRSFRLYDFNLRRWYSSIWWNTWATIIYPLQSYSIIILRSFNFTRFRRQNVHSALYTTSYHGVHYIIVISEQFSFLMRSFSTVSTWHYCLLI